MLPTLIQPLAPPQLDWRTAYERSAYTATGRYSEAASFCRKLDAASPMAKSMVFGKTPEGREMVALVLSSTGEFEGKSLANSKKPLVLLLNGIHAGEIEGKDAGLIFCRDVLISKKLQSLLDSVNIVFIPVFNIDGHERFGAYNRINQNGPKEMGWRVTANNLNLNRDFIKADTLEMQALLGLFSRFKPDFFFDNHTSDGGDWQYHITYAIPTAPTQDAGIAAWSRQLSQYVDSAVTRDGFLIGPYFSLVSEDPAQGIVVSDYTPRFSTGYGAALNRPNILVETHMLKTYKERVEATYSLNKRAIEFIARSPKQLMDAIAAADRAASSRQRGQPVVLSARRTGTWRPFAFKGYEYAPYDSDITGGKVRAWSRSPLDIAGRIQDEFLPELTVAAPYAYAIPASCREVIRLLDVHGIAYYRLSEKAPKNAEVVRFASIEFPARPFEGRFMPQFRTSKQSVSVTLPAGTVIATVAQAKGKLLMQLLEPEAPDSLVRWGFFNAFFEQKESFEDYAMEPIARKMLADDPLLRKEFEERLRDDAFASNPRARLEFFHSRSRYADERLNVYPVLRLP